MCGGVVVRRPFSGTRFPGVISDTSAKLLGSYEKELHPVIENLLADRFDSMVNIGCSDGYYAVGVARRLPPGTRIYAFDIHQPYREATEQTAAANNLGIQVGSICTPEELLRICSGGRTLVISDCEGCEDELIRPELVPNATVLVELHPFAATDQNVPRRFAGTHDIELITSTGLREPSEYPELASLPRETQEMAVFEGRGVGQQRAVLRPRRAASGPS